MTRPLWLSRLYLKPQTPNPKPQILNPESLLPLNAHTTNSKPGSQSLIPPSLLIPNP
jgi:hypothetical protein